MYQQGYIPRYIILFNADFNKQTHSFLGQNVPRMFKENGAGEATATDSESLVGEHVDFEKLLQCGQEGEEKIFKYVQEPLRKWLANFDTVVVRRY
jgi:hypothetical protein